MIQYLDWRLGIGIGILIVNGDCDLGLRITVGDWNLDWALEN